MDNPQSQAAIDEADKAAVRATLSGSTDAFREIVERYSGPIYSLALRLSVQPEDAEEAVQEIFSKVFRGLPQYSSDFRFFSWLYSIAVNYLRSQNLSRRRRQDSATVQFQLIAGGATDEASDLSPEALAIENAARQAVLHALTKIPAKYREVFVLRHIEEFSSRETAEIIGIPESTVKTHLSRARKKLSVILVKWGWP